MKREKPEDFEEEESSEEEILYATDEEEDGPDENDDSSSSEIDDDDIVNEEDTKKFEEDSDEEWNDVSKNTVGKIPMEFYEDYDHIGYNILGEKIARPARKDQLDELLEREDNPDWKRTVFDKLNQKDVVLTDEEYNLIKAVIKKRFPVGYDPYEPMDDFPYEDSIHPIKNTIPPKRSFVPIPRGEYIKIRKYVKRLLRGEMKTLAEERKELYENKYGIRTKYDIWETDVELSKKKRASLPAPKLPLPKHDESYNPPSEYLFDKKEEDRWIKHPEKRKHAFMPQKYSSIRVVPAYQGLLKNRYERCLDLFLCPRTKLKHKYPIESPEDLLPKLPSPEELRPFPTQEAMQYLGHTDLVRVLSVDPLGRFLASGSDDGTVRVWEISTGRCVRNYNLEGSIYSVAWNPRSNKCMLAVSVNNELILISTKLGNEEHIEETERLLRKVQVPEGSIWLRTERDSADFKKGIRFRIPLQDKVKTVSWHFKGDYIVTTCPEAIKKRMLAMHQISTARTQYPWSRAKKKGEVQSAKFHPSKPYLFVATRLYIKVFNLSEKKLEKKLMGGPKWISSFDVHPGGDNIICGGYDSKVNWFDLDLSIKPYKNLNYHKRAVRKVVFHPKYPLFASCSDDLSIHIFHGMVYSDLLKNALIVPLKILRGHKYANNLGILDIVFHPTQPWLFSAGSDNTIRLWT